MCFCILSFLHKKNTFQLSPVFYIFFVNVITKEKKVHKLVAITFQQKNRHLAHTDFFFSIYKKHPAITKSHDLDFQVNSSTKAFFFCFFLFIWLKNLKKKCHKAWTHSTKILIAVWFSQAPVLLCTIVLSTTRVEEDRKGEKKKIWAADFRSDHANFQNSYATTE